MVLQPKKVHPQPRRGPKYIYKPHKGCNNWTSSCTISILNQGSMLDDADDDDVASDDDGIRRWPYPSQTPCEAPRNDLSWSAPHQDEREHRWLTRHSTRLIIRNINNKRKSVVFYQLDRYDRWSVSRFSCRCARSYSKPPPTPYRPPPPPICLPYLQKYIYTNKYNALCVYVIYNVISTIMRFGLS